MNLYLRLVWTWLRAAFKPAIRFGDSIELAMHVWPGDLDINGHMNNGRYMTLTDLAVIEYFSRAGLLKLALRRGWRPMLGGALLSFRRGLKPFKRYTLRLQMVCWDEGWSYMQFEFIHDGQTMALGHAKGAMVGARGIVTSTQSLGALGLDTTSPPFTPSITAWIEADRLMQAKTEQPMNTHQILLVQSTFAELAPHAEAVACLFYARLFELDPNLRRLFPIDMAAQRRSLMAMLAVGVNGLQRSETLLPVLGRLGARHIDYGVRDVDYDTVGAALLDTLDKGLGDLFTPAVKEAWAAAYGLLCGAMRAGASQALTV